MKTQTVYDSTNAQYAIHTGTYDELARLLTSIGANSETATYGYDKASNPTSVKDGRGNLFATAFDPLNRLISHTDPESHTVSYGLNASDRLVSHADGRGIQTTREVDGFGETIQEVSPDRGTSSYWYDGAGNLTKTVDGDSVEADFTYDLANRRTGETFPTASVENLTYTYDATAGSNDGVGRLTSVADEPGSTAFTYDAQGRLTGLAKTIQSRSYSVGYVYDANGKVVQVTYPSGRIVSYTRASDGLVTGVTTTAVGGSAQTVASGVAYRPMAGPLAGLTYGNGLVLAQSVGQNYLPIGTKVSGAAASTLELTYYRDNAYSVSTVVDNASTGRGASYGFTPSGRLSYAAGPWGEYDYGWDGAGNLAERDLTPVGGSKAYTLNAASSGNNWIGGSTDQNGVSKRTLYYGYGGNVVDDIRVGGSTYNYIYNHRKRMVAVQVGGSNVGTYGYDAFGFRVWRTVYSPSVVTNHYVFNLAGHLLAEQNGSTGAVVKEYVWLDDLPLAVIDSSSGTAKTYYIHTGPVNEPLAMTDATRATVWSAYMEPFGLATVLGGASASLDLRLPGQWLEAETGGLNQNWMRDYDPSLGRYIEPDPLGVDAGQNVFAYVDGDPLDWVDPLGLCPKCHTVRMKTTGYDNNYSSTGKSPGDPGYGITANGQTAKSGTVAAPRDYPYGTTMDVPGYGVGTVEDRGGAIKGNHIDLWFPSDRQANNWGKRYKDVIVCTQN